MIIQPYRLLSPFIVGTSVAHIHFHGMGRVASLLQMSNAGPGKLRKGALKVTQRTAVCALEEHCRTREP